MPYYIRMANLLREAERRRILQEIDDEAYLA